MWKLLELTLIHQLGPRGNGRQPLGRNRCRLGLCPEAVVSPAHGKGGSQLAVPFQDARPSDFESSRKAEETPDTLHRKASTS